MDDDNPVSRASTMNEDLNPRPYQTCLYEKAVRENTIIYLPTGTGKTFIAVLLIKHMSGDVVKDFQKDGKRTFFIVNTVALVNQQSSFLSRHTGLTCQGYTGDKQVDFWAKEIWEEQILKNQVLIMTAQIFVNLLTQGIISLKKVNLLIFDECHRAVSNHPMRQIMQRFEDYEKTELPRVLAMSASLLNSNVKVEKVDTSVKELETTFQAKVSTVESLAQVAEFATNPQEKLVYYDPPPNLDIDVIRYFIDKAKTILEYTDISNPTTNPLSSYFLPKSKTSKLTKLLTDVLQNIEEMGLYGGSISVMYHLIQLERIKREGDNYNISKIIDYLITVLYKIQKLLDDKFNNFTGKKLILQHSTPKVIQLLTVLKNFYENHCTQTKFCCIIFVQRRFTTKILYKVLQDLSDCDSEFSFIKPDFAVGYNNDPFKNPKELECLARWNKQALARFRSGVKNCLVATDVIDEGVDIPACKLVIRYYTPMDFRAYIQSKGRARHSTSHFVTLVESKQNYSVRYNNYKAIENYLRSMLHGRTDERNQPSNVEVETRLYDCDIESYRIRKSDGSLSVITEQTAIQLLNTYCASLVKSQYIMLTPAWVLKSKNINKDKLFMIELTLPPASPLHEIIYSDYKASIDAAKRSAAMKACIELYKMGELQENLQPRKPQDVLLKIDHLFPFMKKEEKNKHCIPGTKCNKRRQTFKYPEAFKAAYPKAGKPAFLHVIEMKPLYSRPADNRHKVFFDLLNSSRTLGILSSKSLPELPLFSIFMNVGELQVSITTNQKLTSTLTENEIESLKYFEYAIFEKIIDNVKEYLCFDHGKGDYSFLVVPINENKNIDWEVVNNVVTRVDNEFSGNIKQIKPVIPTIVKNSVYNLALIYPSYRNSNVYIVTEVCIDKKAESPFPQENYSTYINYFQEKHQKYIRNPKQSLLEVKQVSTKINCVVPRTIKINSTRKKRAYETEDFEEHMVPELCGRFDFPSVYWLKITTLPSILHRITHLLVAEELRVEIAAYMNSITKKTMPNHKWKPLQVDRIIHTLDKDQEYESEDGENDVDYDDYNKIEDDTLTIMPESLENIELDYAIINQEMGMSGKDLLDIERYPECANLLSIEEEKKIFSSKMISLTEIQIQKEAEKNSHRKFLNVHVPSLKILSTVNEYGPSTVDIMKSLTAKKSNDFFDLERAETLGDSFLKYAVSNFLFQTYPNFNEGLMTFIKGKLVGNLNLYYCGEEKKLPNRMKVDEFVPSTSLFPAFSIPNEIKDRICKEEIVTSVIFEMSIPKCEKMSGHISNATLQTMHQKIDKWIKGLSISGIEHYFGFQVVPDKTVSDCVEALIGTYLLNSGIKGALELLTWFEILPKDLDIEKFMKPEISDPRLGHGDVNEHLPLASKIEDNIGYKFKNRAFLLQALTHPSCLKHRITSSYERFEFLGDSLLDFLLTAHIYETCGNLTPGELTDLRSALVNNITFACLAVKYELHTALLLHCPKAFELIDRFIRFQELRNYIVNDELLWILLEENDCNMSEHVDVPKILGDIFESIIGAIFLDSEMNLIVVWQVIYRLMKTEIDLFSRNVPKQPIRVIYETTGANPSFSKGQIIKGTDTLMVTLTITSNGEKKYFHGFGNTKKLAKCAASKQALKYLRFKK